MNTKATIKINEQKVIAHKSTKEKNEIIKIQLI